MSCMCANFEPESRAAGNVVRALSAYTRTHHTHAHIYNANSMPGDAASSRVKSTPQDAASPSLNFYNPDFDIKTARHNLPHWDQAETLCFVTFRLADSIPQEKLKSWALEREEWMQKNPQPWTEETTAEYYAVFGDKIDSWLDSGYGSCVLRNPEIRKIVEYALSYFDGERYNIHASVVMPNHVHVLFVPLRGYTLSGILHSWKSYTAKIINMQTGGSGTVWQKESWDRLVRNRKHYNRVVEYIRNNPKEMSNNAAYILGDAASCRVNATPGDAASSRVHSTPQDAASPIASGDAASSRVHSTPQDAASPIAPGDAASSRVHSTPQDAASPIASGDAASCRVHSTPQDAASPIASGDAASSRVHSTPQDAASPIASGDAASSRVHSTPQDAASPIAASSRVHSTPQDAASPIAPGDAASSRVHSTPQDAASPIFEHTNEININNQHANNRGELIYG